MAFTYLIDLLFSDYYKAIYSEEHIPEIKTNKVLTSTIRAINVRNYTCTMSWNSQHRKANTRVLFKPGKRNGVT